MLSKPKHITNIDVCSIRRTFLVGNLCSSFLFTTACLFIYFSYKFNEELLQYLFAGISIIHALVLVCVRCWLNDEIRLYMCNTFKNEENSVYEENKKNSHQQFDDLYERSLSESIPEPSPPPATVLDANDY